MAEPDKEIPAHLESFLFKHPQLIEQVVALIQREGAESAAEVELSPLLVASSSPAALAILGDHNRFYPDSLRTVAAQAVALAITPERLGSTVRKVGFRVGGSVEHVYRRLASLWPCEFPGSG